MRNINANALTQIGTQYGTEPLIIVGIRWIGSNEVFYADKDIDEIPGRILDVGTLDEIINLTQGSSTQVSLKLDDTDGSIKTIMNQHSIHKKTCIIYQYFGDLSNLDDKFILFKGEISSPIQWSEGERSISFSVTSGIKQAQIGFSPEEGQFPYLSSEMTGRPWPLSFGNVLHSPATVVYVSQTGRIAGGNGICNRDESLRKRGLEIGGAYSLADAEKDFFAALNHALYASEPHPNIVFTLWLELVHALSSLESQMPVLKALAEARKREIRELRRQGQDIPFNADFELDFIKAVLKQVSAQKKEAKKAIDAFEKQKLRKLEQIDKMRTEAAKKAVAAHKTMNGLSKQLADIDAAICEEDKCLGRTIQIEPGREFPQGATTLDINGARFAGSFSGNTFTLGANLPVYTEIALSSVSIDECSGRVATATIDQPDAALEGMFALTIGEGNKKHIIKITKQEGAVITFELVSNDDQNNSNSGTGTGQQTQNENNEALNNVVQQIDNDQARAGLLNAQGINWEQQLNDIVAPDNRGAFEALIPEIRKLQNSQDFRNALAAAQDDEDVWKLTDREKKIVQRFLKLLQSYLHPDIALLGTTGPAWTYKDGEFLRILSATANPLQSWNDHNVPLNEIPNGSDWSANPGDTVSFGNPCQAWVANILPSTIRMVAAYRTVNDKKYLVAVPTNMYTKNESNNLGPITATTIHLKRPLSTLPGGGWDDQLYVSMESSVGPNVVDIIQYLVETYTDESVNAANFAAIKAKFQSGGDELYPANFTYQEQQDVWTAISEIAWQARCSIHVSEGEVFINYLSETPTPVATISPSEIEKNTMVISTDATEDLVTKFVANWMPNGLPVDDDINPQRKVIIQNNTLKYGLNEREFAFYIYNIEELVQKSATFWAIRMSNSWKHVFFSVFISHMELETNDVITLDSGGHASTGVIDGVIESAVINPDDDSIDFSVWIPVREGEMTKYDFAWTSDLSSGTKWPAIEDIDAGYSGGQGIGRTLTTFPGCT